MAKDDEIEDIKKLSPEERIKRLREITKKDKEEIEKAHELIRESERELQIEEKVKEVRIPQDQEVDIEELFKPEGEALEETVEREQPHISEEEIRHQQEYLRAVPTQRIEQRAEYLQQRIQDTGYVSNEQRREVAAMYQEVRERQEGLKQGTYKSATGNIEEQLDVTKRILHDIYQG